ncbi:MAG: RloB family protein [Thermodesulfovibrionales bacterium]|nr:RloB family protein [Thermodesulfovibrionales bacterium]
MKRRRAIREPYDAVLIVCEGRKTEPVYFTALKNELRLSSVNIRICGKECGSAPLSVVDYALSEYKKSREYDRVFCVFDKDQHETYDVALQKIKEIKDSKKFSAITSVPCFEFWLLLHFEESARPYASAGNNSVCDSVVHDLKRHVPNYKKGTVGIFALTYPSVDTATKRAELLEIRQKGANTDNPSTKVHKLVAYLRTIKKKTHLSKNIKEN